MVFSELLLKIPYGITWRLVNSKVNPFPIVFYCTSWLDYEVFKNVLEHLPEVSIVAKNKEMQNILAEKGISSILYPKYPEVVIMARHAIHKFPSKKIIKIGMRHGAYNFKKFINAKKYNRFDLYFFTSETELNEAKALDITVGEVGGFPKIDELHNDSITNQHIEELKSQLGFNNGKPIILFSATWESSGLSAIKKWYDKLDSLTSDYNILVTTHPFTQSQIVNKIKETKNIFFIENESLLPYLKLADVLIGDTSSIIAEFASLDKPIITFRVNSSSDRLQNKIIKILDEISFRINNFDELKNVINDALYSKNKHSEKRKEYTKIMFGNLDGHAGEDIANKIKNFLKSKNVQTEY